MEVKRKANGIAPFGEEAFNYQTRERLTNPGREASSGIVRITKEDHAAGDALKEVFSKT